MDVVLKRSSVRKYVEEQVKQGHFASPSEVIEAALMRLMLDDASEPFDAETLAAIKRGDEQIERGEGRDISGAAAEFRAKHKDILNRAND
jgi:Arc/MetJ-type ribon-helix-helix transcriptional regulator